VSKREHIFSECYLEIVFSEYIFFLCSRWFFGVLVFFFIKQPTSSVMPAYLLILESSDPAPFLCEDSTSVGDTDYVTMAVAIPGDEMPLAFRWKKTEPNQFVMKTPYAEEYVRLAVKHFVKPEVKYHLQKIINLGSLGDLSVDHCSR